MFKPLVNDIKLVEIPNFKDDRGGLSVVQSGLDIPFEIARIFYTYGADSTSKRGAHAHRTCWQMLICVTGYMQVESTDSHSGKVFELDSPNKGLLIPPLIWSTQFSYSEGAVCLALASELYSEDEYIRNFEDFLAIRSK
jgi:dTDP-4-dehydrorhamnose 3,5-epimerase-like enzyme